MLGLQTTSADRGSGWLGHPRGLGYLCAAEGVERFSFLGMQSLLVLFMTHQLLLPEHVGRVIGFGALRAAIESVTGPLSAAALASQVFGIYAGLVYLTPLAGGLVADRWLNRTATVTAGAVLAAIGHFLMSFEPAFLIAMLLLVAGVGCFKGNIASQVGGLYLPDDPRRATAFQVFQLFISIAAIVSPLVCGTLGEKVGWHYGFGAAGAGMLIGLAIYVRGRGYLPGSETHAAAHRAAQVGMTAGERKNVWVLVAMLPVLACALIGNQQMFNAFVVWGESAWDLRFAGHDMPVTWILSFDAAISVICLLGVIAFTQAMKRRRREPDDIVKIAIAAAIMAIAPLLLSLASLRQHATGARISMAWALGFEVTNEIGFAVFVPVALSLFSRAAPARVRGLMIGLYYCATVIANLAVGRLGGLLEILDPAVFWLLHAAIILAAAVVLAGAAVWRHRLFSLAGAER